MQSNFLSSFVVVLVLVSKKLYFLVATIECDHIFIVFSLDVTSPELHIVFNESFLYPVGIVNKQIKLVWALKVGNSFHNQTGVKLIISFSFKFGYDEFEATSCSWRVIFLLSCGHQQMSSNHNRKWFLEPKSKNYRESLSSPIWTHLLMVSTK